MKTKVPAMDAQRFKRHLLWIVKKIGRRKRINAALVFDLIARATHEVK